MSAITNFPVSELGVRRALCRQSFYYFVREFWSEIVTEVPVFNWHIKYLCDEFQKDVLRIMANKPRTHDTIVNISPGTTKSTIFSVMSMPWIWTIAPTFRGIFGSFNESLSLSLGLKARDVIVSDKYMEMFPTVRLRDDQKTKTLFANTAKGERRSTTVGAGVTGNHAHIIVVDDPLDPKGARSDEEIKTSNHWISETLPTRKVNKKTASMWVVMQRLHQNDPTGFLLSRSPEQIKHICLPAMLDTALVKPPELAAHYKDGLFDPVRLDREVLRNMELALGQFSFSGQFRQHPVPASGGLFKTERFNYAIQIPPEVKIERCVRYWDKAITQDGGCFTCGARMAMSYAVDPIRGKVPHYWILGMERGQWGAAEREKHILNTAHIDGISTHVHTEQEPGSGGLESAEATIKMLAGFVAGKHKPTGDKVARADTLATQVGAGNVTIVGEGNWIRTMVDELQYFPDSTYKDQVDALSGAFSVLNAARFRVGAL